MKKQAQKIWDTYVNGYSELLCTPVEQFDDSLDEGIKKILASVLRQAINELQKSPGVIMCSDLLELCEELEGQDKKEAEAEEEEYEYFHISYRKDAPF